MKLRSISRERRVASARGYSKHAMHGPIGVTKDRQDARAAGPETVQYVAEWKKPGKLLALANLVAKYATASMARKYGGIRKWLLSDAAEDGGAIALAAYFTLAKDDQPETADDFKQFVYREVARFVRAESRRRAKENSVGPRVGEDGETLEEGWDRVEWLPHVTRAPQENYVDAKKAVELLEHLPQQMKRVAFKAAGGANIAETATELGIDVIGAMHALKAARTLTRWLGDDEKMEKRRARNGGAIKHAFDRAEERYGVEVSREEFVEMTKKIRRGEAILIGDYGPSSTEYIVPFRDGTLPVRYDPCQNLIITVLPKGSGGEMRYLRSVRAREHVSTAP